MAQPNVVFIMSDQHRWDFMGYEAGNGLTHTPNLDRLGQAGTIFRTAYCPSPLCCPSRQAVHAGRYGMNTGCFTNLHELPPGTPSFVQQFRRSGYRTAVVGKTHMEIHAYDSNLLSEKHRQYMDSLGWDELCEIAGGDMYRTGIWCAYAQYLQDQGLLDRALEFFEYWSYFMDKNQKGRSSFSPQEWTLPEEHHSTNFVGQRAIDWLEQRRGTQPFFLHVGFIAPHSPIKPLPRHMDLYRDVDETPAWGAAETPPWLADGRRGYRAMITHIDEWVGKIVDCLAALGELDNTIIVYTSDHGETAGDHGHEGKTCFFEGAVRVPLLMAGPGIRAGQDSDALVEIIDLGKTLCELCGVEPHRLDQGQSLVPVLSGAAAAHRGTIYSEMGCDRMLFDGRYKLMWGDPLSDTRQLGRLHLDKPVNIAPSPCRLYDLQDDPHELNDLAHDPAHRDLLAEMMAKLLVRINENVQPQPNKSRGTYRPVLSRRAAAAAGAE